MAETNPDLIIVDPRQSQKNILSTGIHEALHLACRDFTEKEVIAAEKIICNVVLQLGFRRKKKTKKKKVNGSLV